jgi:phosphohistidine phosphatase
MTLRLILTRHAKSDWDNPLLRDHERALNPRGQRAAPLIGRWLVAQGFVPQQALISDATRTRETWALLYAELPPPVPQAAFLPALYHAGPDVMFKALQTATAESVIMIGHNPGIAEFAALLLAAPPAHAQFGRYPTCATLIAEFDAPDWRAIRYATGTVRAFITPRELE